MLAELAAEDLRMEEEARPQRRRQVAGTVLAWMMLYYYQPGCCRASEAILVWKTRLCSSVAQEPHEPRA